MGHYDSCREADEKRKDLEREKELKTRIKNSIKNKSIEQLEIIHEVCINTKLFVSLKELIKLLNK